MCEGREEKEGRRGGGRRERRGGGFMLLYSKLRYVCLTQTHTRTNTTPRSGSSVPESPLPKESGPLYQEPSTIQHEVHPETEGVCTVCVQLRSKKKKKKLGTANSGPLGMYQVRGCGVSVFCVAVKNKNF